MDSKLRVLLVEDEKPISNFISTILKTHDYQVVITDKGLEAAGLVSSCCPDAILLDLGLPDIDGLEVLRSLREWSDIPVIIVSARGREREKVEALDLGADDYITKPFGTAELLARIRTAVRHGIKRSAADPDLAEGIYTVGSLSVDLEKRIVSIAGNEIHLTPIEFRIVELLVQNHGKVLTHDLIIKKIWGPYSNETQTLRVNMANIRRKIEKNPAEPRYILTEVGVGYRLVED